MELLKESVEKVREDQYLEDLYGANSLLSNKEWLKKMKK